MFLVRSYTPCGLRVRIWDSGFGTLELDENENLDEDRTDAAWNHERVSHGLGLERVPQPRYNCGFWSRPTRRSPPGHHGSGGREPGVSSSVVLSPEITHDLANKSNGLNVAKIVREPSGVFDEEAGNH